MADYSKTINFIKELYGNQEFTPLAVPKFIGNEKKYLEECIDTTFVSSVGKFVDRLEEDMVRYTGCKRAVVCVFCKKTHHNSRNITRVGFCYLFGTANKKNGSYKKAKINDILTGFLKRRF